MQVSKPLSDFVFEHFGIYWGLDVSKLRPTDRLVEDLHLRDIGWQDWDFEFYEDIKRQFHIKLWKYKELSKLRTLGELVSFVDRVIKDHEADTAGPDP